MKRIAIVVLALALALAGVAWTQFEMQDLRAEVDSLEEQMQQDLDARLTRLEGLVSVREMNPGLEASLGRLDILTQNLDVRVQLLQTAMGNRASTSQVQRLETEMRLGDLVNNRRTRSLLEDRVEELERRTGAQASLGLVDRESDQLATMTRRLDRLDSRLSSLSVDCYHPLMLVPPDCYVR